MSEIRPLSNIITKLLTTDDILKLSSYYLGITFALRGNMSTIDDLRPQQSARVIDLVAAAGHDVNDWKNFKGGLAKEASNPKYCYEWAFTQPGKAVVLNLWHEDLKEVNGKVFQHLNYRAFAARLHKTAAQGIWAKRSLAMDAAFNLAATLALPVRVIICDGARRDVSMNPERASSVLKRMIDPVPWAVTNYDSTSGECILTRGQAPHLIEDQFSSDPADGYESSRRSRTYNSFVRDAQVRERVRTRARGFCEYCSRYSLKAQVRNEKNHCEFASAGNL
jgi:5-methylcytosine-specific restriction protein A